MINTEQNDVVLYSAIEGVGTIVLNRPAVHNAINRAMGAAIEEAVLEANSDEAVHVIVIKGAGSKAFSAGADITEFAPPESVIKFRDDKQGLKWTDHIAQSRKPTIALIDGFCLGGGLEIALCCDFRIASEEAVFGLPEVTLGIIPGAGGTQRLPRLVGLAHATRLILSGERIPAHEALTIGLVTESVPASQLDAACARWTERLKVLPIESLTYAKEAIHRGLDLPIEQGLRVEADLASVLATGPERKKRSDQFSRKTQ